MSTAEGLLLTESPTRLCYRERITERGDGHAKGYNIQGSMWEKDYVPICGMRHWAVLANSGEAGLCSSYAICNRKSPLMMSSYKSSQDCGCLSNKLGMLHITSYSAEQNAK